MIAIRDILIFLSGAALLYVAILTRNYLCGRRISVLGMTQVEKPYKSRTPDTSLPEVDKQRLDRLIAEINTVDEFIGTYSRRTKERN